MSLMRELLAEPNIADVFEQGQSYLQEQAEHLATVRAAVAERVTVLLRELRLSAHRESIDAPVLHLTMDDLVEYVSWNTWSLDDACYFAVALRTPTASIARRLAGCHLIYQAGRTLDDVVDGHFDYKGLRPTPLGHAIKRGGEHERAHAEHRLVLLAVLLILRGIGEFTASFGPVVHVSHVRTLLDSASKACVGALLELEIHGHLAAETYRELVELKSTSHNAILLRAFAGLADEHYVADLVEFGSRTSLLGQILNDAVDRFDDDRIGQPNVFRRADEVMPTGGLSTGDLALVFDQVRSILAVVGAISPVLRGACCAKFTTMILAADRVSVHQDTGKPTR